ncbi:MAG: FecR domain-containing protein [Lentisphaeria bacterium]|nr:FecR domain-containing protein [Lentisphaeria bacterium]
MSRIEELTFKWLDGTLSEEECEELERLLAEDPIAQAEHVACCDLEATLRSQAENFDISARTMVRIRSLACSDAQPAPDTSSSPDPSAPTRATRSRTTAFWLRLAAALVVMSAVGLLLLKHLSPEDPVGPADAILATVTQVEAEVVLSRGDGRIPVRPGFVVLDGDTLEVSPSALAVVVYADGTRLVLNSNTQVKLGGATKHGMSGSKLVALDHGELTAHVRKQEAGHPLRVRTPTASVTVRGTRFTVSSEQTSSRVDVIEGRVELRRTEDGASVKVAKSEFAVALSEGDLVAAPLPPRVADGLVALYGFHESAGTVVHDMSAVGQPLDLQINSPDATTWLPGGGLRLDGPTAFIASSAPAQKILDACRHTNELTIEAWVAPCTVNQIGPARIVTLSRDTRCRNFTLGQDGNHDEWPPRGGTRFIARMRTTHTGANGLPHLKTATGSVVADLVHLVFTRSSDGATRIFIDGVARAKGEIKGDFSNWDSNYHFALGDEFTHDRPWLGSYHLVAVYSRALTAEEVLTNFRAGKTHR